MKLRELNRTLNKLASKGLGDVEVKIELRSKDGVQVVKIDPRPETWGNEDDPVALRDRGFFIVAQDWSGAVFPSGRNGAS